MLKCTLSRKEVKPFYGGLYVINRTKLTTEWESSPRLTTLPGRKDGTTEACTPWFPMLRTLFNLNKALVLAACMLIGTGWRFTGG